VTLTTQPQRQGPATRSPKEAGEKVRTRSPRRRSKVIFPKAARPEWSEIIYRHWLAADQATRDRCLQSLSNIDANTNSVVGSPARKTLFELHNAPQPLGLHPIDFAIAILGHEAMAQPSRMRQIVASIQQAIESFINRTNKGKSSCKRPQRKSKKTSNKKPKPRSKKRPT